MEREELEYREKRCSVSSNESSQLSIFEEYSMKWK